MKIKFEIDDETVRLIREVISANQRDQNNSHGPLDFEVLGRLLFEDVALAVRRPGSWEGSKMGDLLSSHGYAV